MVSDKNERHVGLLITPFLVQITFYAICQKIYGSLEINLWCHENSSTLVESIWTLRAGVNSLINKVL